MTETPEIPGSAIDAAGSAVLAVMGGSFDVRKGTAKWQYGSAALAAALPHLNPEPTFTASEVKELTTKATAVALALGRKEACEEAIERLSELAQRIAPNNPHPVLGRDTVVRYLQDIASRVPGGGSKPLTTPSGHSDLPPTPEAAKEAL